MRKIDAYQWNGKEYVYKYSTNQFKTCKEFKKYLNLGFPLQEFKCKFAK